MQAILKGKHQRFCKMIEDVKAVQPVLRDEQLDELENQLQNVYDLYHQQMAELKVVIEMYELKQKAIRSRMRQLINFQKYGHRNEQIASE